MSDKIGSLREFKKKYFPHAYEKEYGKERTFGEEIECVIRKHFNCQTLK